MLEIYSHKFLKILPSNLKRPTNASFFCRLFLYFFTFIEFILIDFDAFCDKFQNYTRNSFDTRRVTNVKGVDCVIVHLTDWLIIYSHV